jgi:hypothetical protein
MWLKSASDEALLAVMLHGAFGQLNPGQKKYGVMPAMAWLGDQELAAAASHVRREFSGSPRDMDAAFVALMRQRFASRQRPWSPKELLTSFPPTRSPNLTLSP